jgi:hypothetical protein
MSPNIVTALFALLLPVAIVLSTFTHRCMKRPNTGIPGQLLAVVAFLSLGGFFAFMAYLGFVDGSIHCFGRRCQNDYSLGQDPNLFWLTFVAYYAAACFLFSVGAGGIRLVLFGSSSEP